MQLFLKKYFPIVMLLNASLFSLAFAEENTTSQMQSLEKQYEKYMIDDAQDTQDTQETENTDLTQDAESMTENLQSLKTFWKTEFNIKTFSDRSATDHVVSTEIYGKLDWDFLNFVSFHTQALIIGRNGFTQSIYDRSDRKNGLYLLEGYFDLHPWSFISVKFGNYKQDFLKAPLLITDRTFPSILQTIHLTQHDKLKTSLVFQQSILTNAPETIKRKTQILRGVPLFLTGSSVIDFNPVGNLSLQNNFTLFSFVNIPSSLAEAGRTRGNTVDYLGNDSEFKYGFLGFYNGASLKIPLFHMNFIEVGGDVLYNIAAPDTFNQGERFYASIYHNFRNFMEIKLMGEYFANQSDSSIAYYNNEVYGHNNRVGGLLKLQTHFYNSGITLGLSYVYSQPINPERSNIGVSNGILFSLGTNYISI